MQLFFLLVPGLRDHTDVLRFLPFDAGNRMVAVLGDATSTFGTHSPRWVARSSSGDWPSS